MADEVEDAVDAAKGNENLLADGDVVAFDHLGVVEQDVVDGGVVGLGDLAERVAPANLVDDVGLLGVDLVGERPNVVAGILAGGGGAADAVGDGLSFRHVLGGAEGNLGRCECGPEGGLDRDVADARAEEGLTRGRDGAHAREGSGRDAEELGGLGVGDEPGGEKRRQRGKTDQKEVEAGAKREVAVSMGAGARRRAPMQEAQEPIPQQGLQSLRGVGSDMPSRRRLRRML